MPFPKKNIQLSVIYKIKVKNIRADTVIDIFTNLPIQVAYYILSEKSS